MKYRTEHDSLGEVHVPSQHYWGAQTQRSLHNFQIGDQLMPKSIILAYAVIKSAAAETNAELRIIPKSKARLIIRVCNEIREGKLDNEFPLVIWQTGSGTQTNMNMNEVIASRAHILSGGKLSDKEKILHPNDDVNASQSSNDTFPTAMHIASYTALKNQFIPALTGLLKTCEKKSKQFQKVVKIGRTHLMDAVPLTLGQEFSGYSAQLEDALNTVQEALPNLAKLPLGGTAVGTGINAPKEFGPKAIRCIARMTKMPFKPAKNRFALIASHDALVKAHSALKQAAVALNKISNDIRLLASGPRTGIGELILPANEPGSSIMPGKVNPTQCEALTMVCTRVMGNDVTMSIAGSNGHLELNTYKPLMAYTLLESAQLLTDVIHSFEKNCVRGLKANTEVIQKHVKNSLMLVTALAPHISYERAAKIAHMAHKKGTTLQEEAIKSGFVTEKQFHEWIKVETMTKKT